MFGVDSISYPTSISTITSHIGCYSCKGVHLSNICTNSNHTYNPIWWDHENPSPFPSIRWDWFPSFHWWFPSWYGSYFRLGGIYLCFGLFTVSFFKWPLNYGVWILWNYFVPDDFICGFNFFFKVCTHIVRAHDPPSILCLVFTFWFLTLKKYYGDICPITISEVNYCWIARTFVIWFKDTIISLV
jgi:hypothetical protein